MDLKLVDQRGRVGVGVGKARQRNAVSSESSGRQYLFICVNLQRITYIYCLIFLFLSRAKRPALSLASKGLDGNLRLVRSLHLFMSAVACPDPPPLRRRAAALYYRASVGGEHADHTKFSPNGTEFSHVL